MFSQFFKKSILVISCICIAFPLSVHAADGDTFSNSFVEAPTRQTTISGGAFAQGLSADAAAAAASGTTTGAGATTSGESGEGDDSITDDPGAMAGIGIAGIAGLAALGGAAYAGVSALKKRKAAKAEQAAAEAEADGEADGDADGGIYGEENDTTAKPGARASVRPILSAADEGDMPKTPRRGAADDEAEPRTPRRLTLPADDGADDAPGSPRPRASSSVDGAGTGDDSLRLRPLSVDEDPDPASPASPTPKPGKLLKTSLDGALADDEKESEKLAAKLVKSAARAAELQQASETLDGEIAQHQKTMNEQKEALDLARTNLAAARARREDTAELEAKVAEQQARLVTAQKAKALAQQKKAKADGEREGLVANATSDKRSARELALRQQRLQQLNARRLLLTQYQEDELKVGSMIERLEGEIAAKKAQRKALNNMLGMTRDGSEIEANELDAAIRGLEKDLNGNKTRLKNMKKAAQQELADLDERAQPKSLSSRSRAMARGLKAKLGSWKDSIAAGFNKLFRRNKPAASGRTGDDSGATPAAAASRLSKFKAAVKSPFARMKAALWKKGSAKGAQSQAATGSSTDASDTVARSSKLAIAGKSVRAGIRMQQAANPADAGDGAEETRTRRNTPIDEAAIAAARKDMPPTLIARVDSNTDDESGTETIKADRRSPGSDDAGDSDGAAADSRRSRPPIRAEVVTEDAAASRKPGMADAAKAEKSIKTLQKAFKARTKAGTGEDETKPTTASDTPERSEEAATRRLSGTAPLTEGVDAGAPTPPIRASAAADTAAEAARAARTLTPSTEKPVTDDDVKKLSAALKAETESGNRLRGIPEGLRQQKAKGRPITDEQIAEAEKASAESDARREVARGRMVAAETALTEQTRAKVVTPAPSVAPSAAPIAPTPAASSTETPELSASETTAESPLPKRTPKGSGNLKKLVGTATSSAKSPALAEVVADASAAPTQPASPVEAIKPVAPEPVSAAADTPLRKATDGDASVLEVTEDDAADGTGLRKPKPVGSGNSATDGVADGDATGKAKKLAQEAEAAEQLRRTPATAPAEPVVDEAGDLPPAIVKKSGSNALITASNAVVLGLRAQRNAASPTDAQVESAPVVVKETDAAEGDGESEEAKTARLPKPAGVEAKADGDTPDGEPVTPATPKRVVYAKVPALDMSKLSAEGQAIASSREPKRVQLQSATSRTLADDAAETPTSTSRTSPRTGSKTSRSPRAGSYRDPTAASEAKRRDKYVSDPRLSTRAAPRSPRSNT